MDAFTYQCPGCGNNLTYDVKSGLFLCSYCSQYYKLHVPGEENGGSSTSDVNEATANASNEDGLMDVRIYHCSSCGSEIMTNDVEVSKFCSYCGQSTIMFDRVSREKKPQKIIPFAITKESALRKAKELFGKGKYIFNSIDEITVDSVYGIYMPFWLYRSKMKLQANVKVKDREGRERQYSQNREEEMDVFLDASRRFKDNVSIKLTPYDMFLAKDFDMRYLSGFYADRRDVEAKERKDDAKYHIEDCIKNDILDHTPGVPPRAMRDTYTSGLFDYRRYVEFNVVKEEYSCDGELYVFLPVYFITFSVNGKTVIILVNGQTGKVVGNVPIDEKKLKMAQRKRMLIFSPIFGIAGAIIFRFMPVWWAAALFAILTYSIYESGTKARGKFLFYYKETNSENMFDLSKNRE